MLISEYENDVTPVLEKLGVTMGNVQKFRNAGPVSSVLSESSS